MRPGVGQTVDGEMTFGRLREGFAQAARKYPEGRCEFSCTLAGQAVRVRIIGRTLAQHLLQPLAHLQAPAETPRLTIDLWDQRETGISCPIDVQRKHDDTQPLHMRFDDGPVMTLLLHGSILCLDRRHECIVGYTINAQELSLYERGRPLHVPLTLWHNDRDVPIIHAGLVARHGQGILFAGANGAGKSTAAITCLCSGFHYLSDDLVGLQTLADGSCLGHSVYNSTYVEADHLRRFPLLKAHAIHGRYPFETKRLVLLSQLFPQRLSPVAPIRAVVLPRVVCARRSKISPASRGKALLALAPSSLAVNQSSGVQGFTKQALLLERVPCFWLDIGQDLRHVPGCVEELMTALQV